MNSLFLDTNFFLDLFDTGRPRHPQAKTALYSLIDHNVALYTSADIISTLSYFLQKRFDLKETVTYIDYIVEKVTILSPSNDDLLTLDAMLFSLIEHTDSFQIDYEDCMQLFLTDKHRVEGLLTSDQRFCRGIVERFRVHIVSLETLR